LTACTFFRLNALSFTLAFFNADARFRAGDLPRAARAINNFLEFLCTRLLRYSTPLRTARCFNGNNKQCLSAHRLPQKQTKYRKDQMPAEKVPFSLIFIGGSRRHFAF